MKKYILAYGYFELPDKNKVNKEMIPLEMSQVVTAMTSLDKRNSAGEIDLQVMQVKLAPGQPQPISATPGAKTTPAPVPPKKKK